MNEIQLAEVPFPQAAELWLEQHKRYIKPNTSRNYTASVKLLVAYLGDILVKDIHIGHVRAYQAERGKLVCAYTLNTEISVLQMIMKEARCWKPIAELYKPLRVPKRRGGHSLSAEEERILREVAFSKPKWRLAAHCMMVMLSTTMGFGELRHIRRREVDLKKRKLLVRDGAKNLFHDRTIPISTAAYESICWILDRWAELGGTRDDEFILPHRPRTLKGPWIFDEPMVAITSAFNAIRKEAGLPQFRVYDCRVQAITKLLSNPAVHPQVSKEIAGHISQAMQSHYSIQQHDTKMAALEALEYPAVRTEPEPTPPVRQPASADLIHPAIQAQIDLLRAEIARLTDRPVNLAKHEDPPKSVPEETHARRKRQTTEAGCRSSLGGFPSQPISQERNLLPDPFSLTSRRNREEQWNVRLQTGRNLVVRIHRRR